MVSTPKKVLFIGLGILALGIVVFTIGLQRSPALWQTFQCGYDLSLNNSSLTRDQISEYCNNQNIETEKVQNSINVGTILLIIGLIIIGTGGIWLIARRRGKERTEKISLSGVSTKIMSNRQQQQEEMIGSHQRTY
jgi:hypothetical protein